MRGNQAAVFLKVAKIAQHICWFGDPILRTQCQEISAQEITSRETQELARKLIEVLKEIRETSGLGRGLAAPQIGVPKRAFVVYHEENYQILINPKIIYTSKELGIYPEMCLSGMPMSAQVIRPWMVEVEYQDMQDSTRTLSANPMLSRLLQHEIDHLDGILFTDKAEVQTISFISDFDEYKTQAKLVQL